MVVVRGALEVVLDVVLECGVVVELEEAVLGMLVVVEVCHVDYWTK